MHRALERRSICPVEPMHDVLLRLTAAKAQLQARLDELLANEAPEVNFSASVRGAPLVPVPACVGGAGPGGGGGAGGLQFSSTPIF